jgi:hypothetical protein
VDVDDIAGTGAVRGVRTDEGGVELIAGDWAVEVVSIDVVVVVGGVVPGVDVDVEAAVAIVWCDWRGTSVEVVLDEAVPEVCGGVVVGIVGGCMTVGEELVEDEGDDLEVELPKRGLAISYEGDWFVCHG